VTGREPSTMMIDPSIAAGLGQVEVPGIAVGRLRDELTLELPPQSIFIAT
jgi:hypothetical protein